MPKFVDWESGVYSIRNTINGRRYIGSATGSIIKRLRDHRYRLTQNNHINKHLQSAWRVYGPTAFKCTILSRCPPENCLIEEQKYIDRFQSYRKEFGYNICPTAGNRRGVKLDKETCLRFSETARRVMRDPEIRKKLSKATRQAMTDPEYRNKQSQLMKDGWAKHRISTNPRSTS